MNENIKEIIKIIDERIVRKQEKEESFESYNAKKKEAELIKKAILRLPIL